MSLRKPVTTVILFVLLLCPYSLQAQTDEGSSLDMKSLEVTNITLSSAAISWVTDHKSTNNWVEIIPVGSDTVITFHDQYSIPHYVHYLVLIDLKPATEYKFRLGSNGTVWDNDDTLYSFKTLESATVVAPKAIYGQVVDTEDNSLNRVLVRIRIKKEGEDYSLTRSVLTNSEGLWTTTYTDFYSKDGFLYYSETGDKVIIECISNYWSATVDSSAVLNGSSPQSLGKVAVNVFDPEKVIRGDLDGSGAINIFDLLDMLKILAGRLDTGDGRLFQAADIDINGVVNIFDLLALLKLLKNA
ncbi:MAG TPA: fibronectin type III domain-containing protein [archaeon]|nr:fibronectin type III domain-containing protein [archaeon]